jgi:long-chain acyl-CoA synthetase
MMLYALPLNHMWGLVATLFGSLIKGSTVVMVPGTGLSIANFMETVEREKGTMFLGVPYIFALAADLAQRGVMNYDLSSLRVCVSAGAPLPVALIQRFKKQYGFNLIDCWGLTEATCHVTCPPLYGVKLGSVGKALPRWEVKIVDSNNQELPTNQNGQIIVRGPMMMGYYDNPTATVEAIKDGWLYTGDVGRLDEDGYLYITGRIKDTIIVKGQNIHPSDVENVLRGHPKVVEVAVIGFPDEMRGEVVGAIISLKEGEVVNDQEIRQFCLDRMINYKVPKQVAFLPNLPKTFSGKIDKQRIKNQLSIPPVVANVQ